MASNFTHLHVHSEYSLLDGLSHIPQLVQRAKELGMDSLALTDHGALYGAVDFYLAAKANGVKPILGCEVYMAHGSRHSRTPEEKSPCHLTLLAKDSKGYQNLIRLVTKAHLEGFYYKPRIDKELLEAHHQGLIALSGCPNSEISRLILSGRLQEAKEKAAWYKELFGDFYLELQEHSGVEEQLQVNKALVPMSQETGIPLVATNDVHYVNQGDAPIQDVLLCIQTNAVVSDEKRMKMADDSFYLKSPQEMSALFSHLPQALESTQHIAEMCDISIPLDRLRLPKYPTPAGKSADEYLKELCTEGVRVRYSDITPQVEERLAYELEVIRKTRFANYFLVVWDIVSFAGEKGILFGVRGSAAASIVLYCLGVTTIDPLEYNLVFERFLNVERKELPDVDIDFQDDRRSEIIAYIAQRYGTDRVAQIVTFGTLGAKAAIRDVGRALGMSYADVDRVARLIPGGYQKTEANEIRPWTIDEVMGLNEEFRTLHEQDESIGKLMDTARRLEGVARNVSTHAAGVVISDEPLINYIPLRRPAKEEDSRGPSEGEPSITMTQYAMDAISKLGLLKMDILGLANLTILDRTHQLLKQTRGIDINLHDIPLDDKKTFELLSSAETTGIFQLESAGMRRYIKELKPSSLNDIAAMVALYRPGPMQNIDRYIRAKHGLEPAHYPHPDLEEILRDTYGVIVYQEQVMLIAQTFAGYTLGEADTLRKAMGKKVAEVMRKERRRFIEGATQKAFARTLAEEIFQLIEKFAMYAFNRAHAVSYAYVAYWTAYLKATYPAEYMASVLSVFIDKADKRAPAVAECRRLGIKVLPPDINHSEAGFSIETLEDGSPAIRFGLGAIKNVGISVVSPILESRPQPGGYASIEEFCRKTDLRRVGKRVMESLIQAGAFNSIGRQGTLLNNIDRILAFSQREARLRETGQATMFDLLGSKVPMPLPSLELEGDDVTEAEKREWNRELLGVSLLQNYEIDYRRIGEQVTLCGEIVQEMAPQRVTVAGMVSSVRELQTKEQKVFAVVTLEDISGNIEVNVWPDTYQRSRELWAEGNILVVVGKVRVRGDRVSISCDVANPYASMVEEALPPKVEAAITPAAAPSTPTPEPITKKSGGNHHLLYLTLTETDDQDADLQRLNSLVELLSSFPGEDPVRLTIISSGEQTAVDLPQIKTRYCPQLHAQLVSLLGEQGIRVIPS